MKSPSIQTEDQAHKSILNWIRLYAPACMVWHVPNGGSRHRGEAMNLKALGVRPGVPDLTVIPPGGVAHFIEVKRPKSGTISPEQHAFAREVQERGGRWGVARTRDEAKALFVQWGLPFSETVR